MADGMRRFGLIVNPYAGRGVQANLAIARKAVEALCPEEIVTGPDELGAGAMQGWGGVVEEHLVGEVTGRVQTQRMARVIIDQRVDALIVLGGDGTMADVAQVCIEYETPPPIIGIGIGSTNVGRLITCKAESIATLLREHLRPETVDAVLVYCNGELLGLGFNDGVIGFTVVGTIEGQMRDIDAAERMRGRNVPGTPLPIGTSRTKVTRTGTCGSLIVGQGEEVGTVIVGFTDQAFFGKAVTGGVCLTTLTGLPAGCLVCDRPLVQVEVEASALINWPPIATHYVSLDEETRIYIEGVRDGAALCADGNPIRLLGERDRAEFAIRRAAVTVLRLSM